MDLLGTKIDQDATGAGDAFAAALLEAWVPRAQDVAPSVEGPGFANTHLHWLCCRHSHVSVLLRVQVPNR